MKILKYEVRRTKGNKFVHIKWFELSPPVYLLSRFEDKPVAHMKSATVKFENHKEEPKMVSTYDVFKSGNGYIHSLKTTNGDVHSFEMTTDRHFPFCDNYEKENPSCPVCGSLYTHGVKKHFFGMADNTCSKDCAKVLKRMSSLYVGGTLSLRDRPDVTEKREKTFETRYGVKNAFANPDVQNKVRDSVKSKHGVDNVSQLKSVKEKIRIKSISSFYGGDFEEFKIKFNEDRKTIGLRAACEKHNISYVTALRKLVPEEDKKARSLEQKEFTSRFSDMTGYNFEQDVRSFFDESNLLEIDILNREHKIAIEYNGTYWHGKQSFEKDLTKAVRCRSKGYTFFAVDEHVTDTQMKILADITKSEKTRIFARKTTIKKITSKEASLFCEENHLQGYAPSRIRYGLFYEGSLVQVMTFGHPRYSNEYDFELIRYATKKGLSVIGGANKLFSTFSKENDFNSIVSYCDNSFFEGKVYTRLGFERQTYGIQNYKWVRGKERYSRYQTQKHKLDALLETYDHTLSETENMKMNGFRKVYDLGQSVFVFRHTRSEE